MRIVLHRGARMGRLAREDMVVVVHRGGRACLVVPGDINDEGKEGKKEK